MEESRVLVSGVGRMSVYVREVSTYWIIHKGFDASDVGIV